MAVHATSGEAMAQPRKVGAPVVAQAHQLTIEDDTALADRVSDLHQLREVIRTLAAVARAQLRRAAVVAQLRAAAVPLDLERPRLAVGHGTRGQKHRRDE